MKTVCKDAPDVLDLDNSTLIGGGGVGDAYGEDAATEDQTFTPWTRVVARHDLFTYSSSLLSFPAKTFVLFATQIQGNSPKSSREYFVCLPQNHTGSSGVIIKL